MTNKITLNWICEKLIGHWKEKRRRSLRMKKNRSSILWQNSMKIPEDCSLYFVWFFSSNHFIRQRIHRNLICLRDDLVSATCNQSDKFCQIFYVCFRCIQNPIHFHWIHFSRFRLVLTLSHLWLFSGCNSYGSIDIAIRYSKTNGP